MPEIAVPLMIGGAGIGALGAIQQGRAAASAGRFQNNQDTQQAGQVMASAERQESNAELQGTLARSAAIAKAGMGGASVDNPNIVNDIGNIGYQSHYNEAMALYNGQEKASGLDLEGQVAKEQGNEAENASYFKAASGILGTTGSSMMMKYSDDGGAFTQGSGGADPSSYGAKLNWGQ